MAIFADILMTNDILSLFERYESDLGALAQLECFRLSFERAASYYEEIGNYTRAGHFDAAEKALKRMLEEFPERAG